MAILLTSLIFFDGTQPWDDERPDRVEATGKTVPSNRPFLDIPLCSLISTADQSFKDQRKLRLPSKLCVVYGHTQIPRHENRCYRDEVG